MTPHADGAGDVQSLPARSGFRRVRSLGAGASAASAARRCRRRRSSALAERAARISRWSTSTARPRRPRRSTMMPLGEAATRADTVGMPLPCADIVVMDDDGREVPPGASGELWIGGPMVVPGYWHNPEADRAAFRGGYWKSGDLGSVDARRLRAHPRPQEGHDQSRRLQDLLHRGRERARAPSRRGRVRGDRPRPTRCSASGFMPSCVPRDAGVDEAELQRFCAEHSRRLQGAGHRSRFCPTRCRATPTARC